MLVLSRHKDEVVWIGGIVKVVVVETRRDRCRLGFDAPSEVAIHRGEVEDHMRRNEGEVVPLARRKQSWLHTWEQGIYVGATKCNEVSLSHLMKPEEASYRGVYYRITDSSDCPLA